MADEIQDSSQINDAQTTPALPDQSSTPTPAQVPAGATQVAAQPTPGPQTTPVPNTAMVTDSENPNGPQTTQPQNNATIPEKQPQGMVPQQQPQAPKSRAQAIGGHLHELGEALAGGPNYKYDLDPNTGTITKTPQPLSGRHIAMAIALEALTGALSGLGKTGPSKYNAAANAGLQQGEQIAAQKQQADKQQEELQAQNFTRNYQTTQANMHMLQLATTSARQNNEFRQQMINDNASHITQLKQYNPSAIVDEHLPGSRAADLQKYPINEYTRIPDGQIPKIGPDGHEVWQDPRSGKVVPEGTEGAIPATELTYAVVKNTAKVSTTDQDGNIDPIYDKAVKIGALPPNWSKASGELSTYQDTQARTAVGNYNAFTTDADRYFTRLNGENGQERPAPLKMPVLKDQGIQLLIDDAAKKYGVPVELARAVAQQESGGKEGAVSPKGAIGVMQLMPATAAALKVDPNNVSQNVDGGVRYLKQQLDNYKGNTKLALAAYNAGPGNVTDHVPMNGETDKYVDSISKMIGLDDTQKIKPADKYPEPDWAAEAKKNSAILPAMTMFNSALTQTNGSYEKAMGMVDKQNPAGGTALTNLMGGSEALKQHDNMATLQQETTEAQSKSDITEQRAKDMIAAKTASDTDSADHMVKMLNGPDSFEFTPQMSNLNVKDLKAELQRQGVETPANFDELYKIAHYQNDPGDYHARIWRKGDPNGMSKGDANQYISKFLNPDFRESTYGALSNEQRQLLNPESRTNRGIVSIGTAVNHIEQLRQAAKEAASGELGGALPLLNKIAQDTGTKLTGADTFKNLQVVANAVNSEVNTALAGGYAPHETQTSEVFSNLNAANSIGQINKAADSYTHLLAGRLKAANEPIRKTTGKDIPFISQDTIDAFKRNGIDTSWYGEGNTSNTASTQPQNNIQQPNEKPVTVNGKIVGYTVDGKTYSRMIGQ